MQRTAIALSPSLTVTAIPTAAQVHVWWHAMKSDDLSVAYADIFPHTLATFRTDVVRGEKMLLLCLVEGQVAGAFWLRDMMWRHDGTVAAGWIECYILLPYRGHLAVQLWRAARRHWEADGIRHFFSAIHVANRPSRLLISHSARFHRVGRFPRFTQFHGHPADVFIYSLHAEDAVLAWKLATARATRHMSSVTLAWRSKGNSLPLLYSQEQTVHREIDGLVRTA